jgi:hypothetical protein
MKKNLLIFLYPFNFKHFDYDRYECKYLKKDFQLEIHDFNKILYPHFMISNKENVVNYKFYTSFNTVSEWEKYLNKKIIKFNKIGLKIFVLNFIQNDTFSSFKILRIIKKLKIIRVDIKSPGLPAYSHDLNFLIKNLFDFKYKFKQLIYRSRYTFENFKIIIYRTILNNIIRVFYKAKPDFLLVAGRKYINEIKEKHSIINFNTWDYSRFLRLSKYNNFLKENYAVYLANPGPENISDSQFWKTKHTHTLDWYKSLNAFFSNIEKKYKLKVVIALHPKAKPEKRHPYLKYRRSYYNKTLELVKNSMFVITYDSTSTSYAVIYNKPIYFIYSNELKKNPSSLKYSLYLSNMLGSKTINIDEYKVSDLKLLCSKRKYKNYIKDYLTNHNSKKTNYKIISNLLKKNIKNNLILK